jgi:hypothetical protein
MIGIVEIQWDALARRAVAEQRAAGRFVPGLGNPVHKTVDPRTAVIIYERLDPWRVINWSQEIETNKGFCGLLFPLANKREICYSIYVDTITTIKVHRQTAKRLKLLAAMQEDTMMNVLDRLIEAEIARMQERGESKPPHAGNTRVQD